MPEFQDIRQIVLIADDNHCRLKRADVPFLMPEFQDIRQIVLIADDNHCRLKRAAEISVCIDAHPTISRRGVRWLCVAGEAACSGMAALPAACHSAGESGVEK